MLSRHVALDCIRASSDSGRVGLAPRENELFISSLIVAPFALPTEVAHRASERGGVCLQALESGGDVALVPRGSCVSSSAGRARGSRCCAADFANAILAFAPPREASSVESAHIARTRAPRGPPSRRLLDPHTALACPYNSMSPPLSSGWWRQTRSGCWRGGVGCGGEVRCVPLACEADWEHECAEYAPSRNMCSGHDRERERGQKTGRARAIETERGRGERGCCFARRALQGGTATAVS